MDFRSIGVTTGPASGAGPKCNDRDCHRLLSRARKHAATSPLSRVTAAAFLLASEYATASSPARDHACVCVCFILCYRIPYIAYVASPALAHVLINPRRACAARVTVVVLCVCPSVCPSVRLSVCLSTTILGLQATRRLMSDTNIFSATRVRKLNWRFC